MDTNLRITRCGLCREEGHNYRTCNRVEVIHRDLKHIFRRIVIDNSIITIGEGMELACRWLHDYSIVALRALARKHGLCITHSKDEYCIIFKRLYLTLALHEIQVLIDDQIYREMLLELVLLREERIQAVYDQIPPIQMHKNEDMSDFDCPICLETIEKDEHKITINCGHRFCQPCMLAYLNVLQANLENNETIEGCIPKCALCRSKIVSIQGYTDK